MSKRAASGESVEAAHDGAASPQRMEQQRSHGISSKALHHGATAYPSEMQLQQVRAPYTHRNRQARQEVFSSVLWSVLSGCCSICIHCGSQHVTCSSELQNPLFAGLGEPASTLTDVAAACLQTCPGL